MNDKTRTRNWATVVYPESAPSDWMTILDNMHIPALISPLHDRDTDENGNNKKPHYHVLLLFNGVKNRTQVSEIISEIHGVGAEYVHSSTAYARYLCHLDSPKKTQYSISEVTALSGAQYSDLISISGDRYNYIGEILDYCSENNVVSFAKLMIYAKNNRKQDWFKVLCDHSYAIFQFLRSRTWEEDHQRP